VQRGEGRIAGRRHLAREAPEKVAPPFAEVHDAGCKPIGMQAEPQHVDRRREQRRIGAGDQRRDRAVRGDHAPVTVDGKRGKRLVRSQDTVERGAHWLKLGRVELVLTEHGRVTRGQQQGVALSQRHLEAFGQVQDHVGAGSGAAGLDEAQVTRGHARFHGEIELAESATVAPVAQQRPDSRSAGDRRHRHNLTHDPLPIRSLRRRWQSLNLPAMTDTNTLVATYLAAFNESNEERRRALVEQAFAEDATYLDPLMSAAGTAELTAMIGGARAQFPSHRFVAGDRPDAHHDVVRFGWHLVDPAGARVATGLDVASLAPDGRMRSVIGFLETAEG